MAFDILITISFLSLVQSIFGTGVLLFGTPILLILGYNFQYSLIILLPISVSINLLQIKLDMPILVEIYSFTDNSNKNNIYENDPQFKNYFKMITLHIYPLS